MTVIEIHLRTCWSAWPASEWVIHGADDPRRGPDGEYEETHKKKYLALSPTLRRGAGPFV